MTQEERKPNHSERNKELIAFLKARVKLLSETSRTKVLKYPPKKRELFKKQIRGRILECKYIIARIARGDYEKVVLK